MVSISRETIEAAHSIYKHLADEESKFLFENRLGYNFTQNSDYMCRILRKEWGLTLNGMESVPEEGEIIVYGAGEHCDMALCICETLGKKVSCICDKDTEKQKKGWYRDGFVIISPEQLINEHKKAYVLISAIRYGHEIAEWLEAYFPRDAIILLGEENQVILHKEQYFDDDIIHLEDGEIFVDGGCFEFDSSRVLLEKCKADKIYAFEPDDVNIKKIQEVVAQDYQETDIVLFQKGLWNKEDILHFNAGGDMESCIAGDGEMEIEVAALDELIKSKVTFIKMDIEGSEMNALLGSETLIKSYKPKLAICIYHKLEDIIDIPAYIIQLVPEYKLYIRHYSWAPAEMVLYAIL